MVGTVNIAYPANKATFGRLVKGYPSLAIRKGGWETKMLSGKIVDKSFELSNIDEWGFLVGKEEMCMFSNFRKFLFYIKLYSGRKPCSNAEEDTDRGVRTDE